jgi:hypothetical protein
MSAASLGPGQWAQWSPGVCAVFEGRGNNSIQLQASRKEEFDLGW